MRTPEQDRRYEEALREFGPVKPFPKLVEFVAVVVLLYFGGEVVYAGAGVVAPALLIAGGFIFGAQYRAYRALEFLTVWIASQPKEGIDNAEEQPRK